MAHANGHRPSGAAWATGATVFGQDALLGRLGVPDLSHEIEQRKGLSGTSSEARLMATLLLDAIKDAQRTGTQRKRQLSEEARLWLRTAGGVFSAEHCCHVLGLDYGVVRVALERQWRALDAARERKSA